MSSSSRSIPSFIDSLDKLRSLLSVSSVILKINKYFLLSLVCSLSYPVFFIFIYDATMSVIVCSLIHALCAAIIMYRVVSQTLLREKTNVNMAVIFILINLLYFSASSVKYFETELYPGFVQDNIIRLIFSLVALAVLSLSFEIIAQQKQVFRPTKFIITNNRLLVLVVLVILTYILWNILDIYEKGIGYIYKSNIDPLADALARTELPLAEKIQAWLFSTGFVTSVLVLLLAIRHERKKGWKLIIATGLMVAVLSIFSGSRGILFFFTLGMMLSLFRLSGIGKKLLSIIFLTAPIIISTVSLLILSFSDRISPDDLNALKYQLAYRFDLTDYAATLIRAEDPLSFNYKILVDAAYFSIPQVVYPGKYAASEQAASIQIAKAGLNEDTDYPDTYFSMGAQLVGALGFIIVPLSMVGILYLLEIAFHRLFGPSSFFITVLMLPLYMRVETDLNSFFADWRMVPIYVLVSLIVYYLFVKSRKVRVSIGRYE